MLRVRINPKMSRAAVMKLDTAYRAIISRQERGSMGTSRGAHGKHRRHQQRQEHAANDQPRPQRCA